MHEGGGGDFVPVWNSYEEVLAARVAAADQWTGAVQRLQQQREAAAVVKSTPWWRRWGPMYGFTRRDAERRYDGRVGAARAVVAAGVGAQPHSWGVLSGGTAGTTLENTLRDLAAVHEGTSAGWCVELLKIRRDVLHARISAAMEGDRGPEAELTARVAAAAAVEPPVPAGVWTTPMRLAEHLPAHLRPGVESVCELDTNVRRRPVTLLLDAARPHGVLLFGGRQAAPDQVHLADITVPRELKGSGLGTAALAELCRAADSSGVTLTGEINPGPKAGPEAVQRLRGWYSRHGFEVDGLGITRYPVGQARP